MNFELDDVQGMLRDSARGWLQRNYAFDQRRKGIGEGWHRVAPNWQTFADMGWLSAGLPEEAGGLGGSVVETALLMEQFGEALVVEPLAAIAVVAAQTLLAIGGSTADEEVREIATGHRRMVLAHAEAEARERAAFVSTQALASGNGWMLSGTKAGVAGGPAANSFLVSARTTGGIGDSDGLSLFVIDRKTPGLSIEDHLLADGTGASWLTLERVKVMPDALRGKVGQSFGAICHGLAHGAVMEAAEAVGAMQKAFEMTREYIQVRQQFGTFIGRFQALQHRIADMLIELELARSALLRAISSLQSGDAPDTAVLRVQIARAARLVGGQAIQLHGGIGVTDEYPVGHYFKRLIAIANASGGAHGALRSLTYKCQSG